jgi:hypothetical protein
LHDEIAEPLIDLLGARSVRRVGGRTEAVGHR